MTSTSSKADPRILYTSGRDVPETDTCNMKVSGEVRPILLKNAMFFEVADCGRIDRRECAILGVSAEISQISDAPGLDGVGNCGDSLLNGSNPIVPKKYTATIILLTLKIDHR